MRAHLQVVPPCMALLQAASRTIAILPRRAPRRFASDPNASAHTLPRVVTLRHVWHTFTVSVELPEVWRMCGVLRTCLEHWRPDGPSWVLMAMGPAGS